MASRCSIQHSMDTGDGWLIMLGAVFANNYTWEAFGLVLGTLGCIVLLLSLAEPGLCRCLRVTQGAPSCRGGLSCRSWWAPGISFV